MDKDRIVEKVMSWPIVQWGLDKSDIALQVVNEAVTWKVKGSSEANPTILPWLVFLPILITVQTYRMVLSATFILLSGHAITREDTCRYIANFRQNINFLRKSNLKQKEQGTSYEPQQKLIQLQTRALLTKLVSLWPIRLFIAFIQDIYDIAYKQITDAVKAIRVDPAHKDATVTNLVEEENVIEASEAPESENVSPKSQLHPPGEHYYEY